MPGSPCLVRVLPFRSFLILGSPPPRMTMFESSRSSAVSTVVTSTLESSSPHGVCFPNACRYHSLKSVSPAFWVSLPASS